MKRIPSRVHGTLDYIVGVVLLLAPSIFGFADDEPARNSSWIVGAATLLYSLFTAYELSLAKLIPYRVHLGFDVLGGLFLAASPWLLDFADRIAWPHVLVGLLEIGVAVMSLPAVSTSGDHHLPHTPAPMPH